MNAEEIQPRLFSMDITALMPKEGIEGNKGSTVRIDGLFVINNTQEQPDGIQVVLESLGAFRLISPSRQVMESMDNFGRITDNSAGTMVLINARISAEIEPLKRALAEAVALLEKQPIASPEYLAFIDEAMKQKKLAEAQNALDNAAKAIDASGCRLTITQGPDGPILAVALK